MFRFVSSACAILMAVSVPFAAPAIAMPVPQPAWDAQQNVVPVQSTGRSGGRWDGNSRHYRQRPGYYRGYRGSRTYRRGYRQHGGYWFPPAAFIAGAIIGGAIASQSAPRYRSYGGNAHVEWCYSRYRSYRAYDNTFQPYNGPRRQCRSPYR